MPSPLASGFSSCDILFLAMDGGNEDRSEMGIVEHYAQQGYGFKNLIPQIEGILDDTDPNSIPFTTDEGGGYGIFKDGKPLVRIGVNRNGDMSVAVETGISKEEVLRFAGEFLGKLGETLQINNPTKKAPEENLFIIDSAESGIHFVLHKDRLSGNNPSQVTIVIPGRRFNEASQDEELLSPIPDMVRGIGGEDVPPDLLALQIKKTEAARVKATEIDKGKPIV